MSDLAQNYRFHRQYGMRAFLALEAARTDLEKSVDRYPTCGDIGAASEDGARFVERPALNGLRFVGYADKLVCIGHTGWFTDRDGSSKLRGVVYQLPARKGRPVYVAGHDVEGYGDAKCGGPAMLDFSTLYFDEVGLYDGEESPTKREAAYAADSFAEREAEEERDYQTAWQAGSLYQQTLEEYRDTRKTILAGLKHARTAAMDVRAKWVEMACETRRECFREMGELLSGDHKFLAFYPSERLVAAFNEGRGT